MLLPEEAKRIKFFSVSFVSQSRLDKYIEDNNLDVIVIRSGDKTIYKPSIEDVDKKNWENFLSWIKQSNTVIYVNKENQWKIYKWKKEKSKLAKTKILETKPKKRKKLQKYGEFKIEAPKKPDTSRDIK